MPAVGAAPSRGRRTPAGWDPQRPNRKCRGRQRQCPPVADAPRQIGTDSGMAERLQKAIQAKRRRRANPLNEARVAPVTRSRYREAQRLLLQFWKKNGTRPTSPQQVDDGVAAFIEHTWRQHGSLLLVNNVIAAVPFFMPRLAGKLKLCWKLQKTWLKLEPNVRAMPLSPLLAAAFAGAFCWWGLPRIGALLALGYAAFLRTGEILGLRRRDVRYFERRNVVVIALHHTKTGQRHGQSELAVVRSETAVRLVKQHILPLALDEIILGVDRAEFYRLFRRVVCALHLEQERVTLYSFRRGGATHDFLEHGSMEMTLLKGRWATARSARVYVQDAVATLADVSLTPEQISIARLFASHL